MSYNGRLKQCLSNVGYTDSGHTVTLSVIAYNRLLMAIYDLEKSLENLEKCLREKEKEIEEITSMQEMQA